MNFFKVVILILTLFSFSYGQNAREMLSSLVTQAFHEAEENNHYISLAALNKMLSQKIAKDAAKIVTKIDDKRAKKEILEDAKKFDRTINAFLYGDKELGVSALSNPLAKKELNDIVAIWKPFYASAKKLATNKKIDLKAFLYIYNNNEPLLGLSHQLTQTLKSQRKFKTTFNPVIEHLLKFLDKQRFLTQKMVKEKFFIFRKIDVKRNKVRLNGSFILFEHSLNGMLHGDKKRGLVPVTNRAIRAKLLELQKEWNSVKDLYKFKHRNLTKKDMLKLNNASDKMLKITQDLVYMVEKSLGI